MVTINDKISLIIDIDNLFSLNDPKVQNMINGDTFLINELYKKSLNHIKEKSQYKFKHIIAGNIKTLNEWMDVYQCKMDDFKSIIIFLRLAEPMLLLNNVSNNGRLKNKYGD